MTKPQNGVRSDTRAGLPVLSAAAKLAGIVGMEFCGLSSKYTLLSKEIE